MHRKNVAGSPQIKILSYPAVGLNSSGEEQNLIHIFPLHFEVYSE